MKNKRNCIITFIFFTIVFGSICFAKNNNKPVPVTISNYIRAETDMQFKGYAKRFKAFGKLYHMRKFYNIEHQITVRPNRDTLYSIGVFDLTYPVEVILPDPGDRYMSMQVIGEDHYTPFVFHGPGKFYVTKECVKTRYVLLGVRIFVNAKDPKDFERVHNLQDSIIVHQDKIGKLELPNWDKKSLLKIRRALEILGATMPTTIKKTFGTKYEVDPIKHLIATAIGWGGLPEYEVSYFIYFPKKNNGKIPYVLTFRDKNLIQKNGFWSITVYDEHGYLRKNKWNIYSYNNTTTKRNPDGTVTIHFGGASDSINFIPIYKGWNYGVRIYRPTKEFLKKNVIFPEAIPAK